MAPMQRALAIQALFEELGIDFLANSEWAGSSPDLNPTENLGSITIDKFDAGLEQSKAQQKYFRQNRMKIAEKALNELALDTELLSKLITGIKLISNLSK